MNRTAMLAAIAAVLALGLGLGYFLGRQRSETDAGEPSAKTQPPERKALYWYDPMVPDQHFDQPGKSPFMDMMLVPRYADEVGGAGVAIDPGTQQNLGIRTAVVEVAQIGETLRVPGTLQWDLRAERRVSARVDGFIEQLHVRAPYARVARGAPLATLLAPALSSALAEYRALSGGKSEQAKALRDAARSRLRVLGLSEADVRAAPDGVPRIVLRAPSDGVVAEIGVREGDTVTAGQALFRINATDTLWLEARLPQAAAGAVSPGTAVDIFVDAVPDVRFRGTVETLLPDVDAATRTQVARIVLENRAGRLAAGQFAEALLTPTEGRRCPLVPNEALILTGREARVIVKGDDGRFQPVRVRTGRQVGERTEILDGLVGGEHVVVSGQFLIDSEASLSGVLSRLSEKAAGEDSP